MANWCSNWVNLSGKPEGIKAFIEDIKALNKKGIEEDSGVKISDSDDAEYMFEFYIDEDSFSFTTKWSPDYGNLRHLAQRHEVMVINRYEELGCCIYGEWQCDGLEGSETDTFLEEDEFDLVVDVNDDYSLYKFEDEESDCREDLLSIVLERKINGYPCKSENS